MTHGSIRTVKMISELMPSS